VEDLVQKFHVKASKYKQENETNGYYEVIGRDEKHNTGLQ